MVAQQKVVVFLGSRLYGTTLVGIADAGVPRDESVVRRCGVVTDDHQPDVVGDDLVVCARRVFLVIRDMQALVEAGVYVDIFVTGAAVVKLERPMRMSLRIRNRCEFSRFRKAVVGSTSLVVSSTSPTRGCVPFD